jgi:hypothetical protein
MSATGTHTTIEELLEAVLSLRSVLRLYNKDQLSLEQSLEMSVKRVEDWCELAPDWELVSGVSVLVSE